MASLRYSGYRREEGRNPTGTEIVEALLKDAEPAVAIFDQIRAARFTAEANAAHDAASAAASDARPEMHAETEYSTPTA